MPRRKFTGYSYQWLVILAMTLLSTVYYPLFTVSARYTPEDAYQEKRAVYDAALAKISDSAKVEKIKQADSLLNQINQSVTFRFDEEINRLGAIMMEVRRRQGITETRVAFGGVETDIEQADYWVNYAAEAVAYQKIQDYTPQFSSESQAKGAITASMNNLENDLEILKGKILKAKTEVGKVIK
jgi:hypothetical protein